MNGVVGGVCGGGVIGGLVVEEGVFFIFNLFEVVLEVRREFVVVVVMGDSEVGFVVYGGEDELVGYFIFVYVLLVFFDKVG